MLIKIACATAICFCSWLLGNGYKNSLSEKIKIIDCYYKKRQGSKISLHLVKFSGNRILFSSEEGYNDSVEPLKKQFLGNTTCIFKVWR